MSRVLALLAGIALVVSLGAASAWAAVPDSTSAGLEGTCASGSDQPTLDGVTLAPPCGYIYPSILPGFSDMSDKPSPGELPEKATLHIVFTWDMEGEGTGLPDPLQEIVLTHQVANGKIPDWLKVSFEPAEHSFMLNPLKNQYEFNTTVTFTVDPDIEPSEETGKRLMLLVKSTESGTFKPSFGVEVVNFQFGEATVEQVPESQFAPVGIPLVVPVVAAAAILAFAVRRRR